MEERAAVLRAARDRIQRLSSELETANEHVRRKFPGAEIARDVLVNELKLLTAGVNRLWTGGNGNNE